MAFSSGSSASSVPPGFVDALVTYAETLQSDDDLRTEFAALFAKMQTNLGKEVIASTVNGKYFGFQVTLSVESKFAAFGEAIRRYNGDSTVCTYPDWSGIVR